MNDGNIALRGSTVWRDFYGFVYHNLRTQGLSHFDAEDLTQDILETACTRLDEVDPRRRRAWLLTVTRNKVVDRARRSRNMQTVAELPESPDPALGPDEIAMRSADRELLLEALGRLRTRDRQLLEVRYLEERSVVETAERFGMSIGATKVALHRARERLRARLEDSGVTLAAEGLTLVGRAGRAASKGASMGGIGDRAVQALAPFVGRTAADTCVRGTAVSIGKTFDTLDAGDYEPLAIRIRRVLAPLLPPDTIERLLTDIQGGLS